MKPNNKLRVAIFLEELKKFKRDEEKLEMDKAACFGTMMGQLGAGSRERVRQTDIGEEAMNKQLPLRLKEAILASHLVSNRRDNNQRLYEVQRVYQKIKMDDKESIASYYERFKAIWEHYAASAITANQDAHLPDGEMQAMHFIYGLSHNYSQFRDHTLRKVLEMPKSLREAYDAVCDYGTNSRAYYSSDERSNTLCQ